MNVSYSVIFDMDGVIFDSEQACLACWRKVAGKYGIREIEEVFTRCIGTNKNQTREIHILNYQVSQETTRMVMD